jgi:hypothetical protein
MKQIFVFFSLLILILTVNAANKKIEISNPGKIARTAELVEIQFSKLCKSGQSDFILKDESGKEIAYQLVLKDGKPSILLFQASVPANGKSVYQLLPGKPAPVKAKTFGRQVPERKDDFAWENDLAAYRMYGPALVKENPSNGADLWLKRTSELIVDTFYFNELKKGLSYHIDHGKGLDCYKVGHTLGCGGIAPFVDGKLYVNDHYNAFKVLENGPLRTRFVLKYDTIKAAGKVYQQELIITCDAGSPLNKAEVKLTGPKASMKLAGGIFLHDEIGNLKQDKSYIAYAENAVSNAGLPSGSNYVGVVFPTENTEYQKDKIHALILSAYQTGKTFTYYFGGGWSKWQYPTDEAWFKAMEDFTVKLKNPLKIKIK